jgi:hypothetical protein
MKKSILTEDWTVVLFGFIIIGVALVGVKIPSPSFGWETASDLTEKVLTAGNLIKLGQIFVFTFVIALLAASVLGKSVVGTAKGFPIVFVLTSLAFEGFGPAIVPATAIPAWIKGDFTRVSIPQLPRRVVGWASRKRPVPNKPTRAALEIARQVVAKTGDRQPGVTTTLTPSPLV